MTPLTVACVWVQGQVPYTAEYVERLQAMVRRHLARQHAFVCLTDQPCALREVPTISIPGPDGLPGWWSKVRLFDPAMFSGRVLYLDLDSLVVGPLEPVVDMRTRFALVPHSGSFTSRRGLQVVRRYNSSVMVWDTGHRDLEELWTLWTPDVATQLHGDQDWIGIHAQASTFPPAWFPRLSELDGPPFAPEVKVILSKKPKNAEAAAKWPWFDALWRAA